MQKLHVALGLVSMGIAAFATNVGVGCGSKSDDSAAAPTCSGDCVCTGNDCTCKTGGNCTFGGAASASSDGGDAGATPPPDNATFHCDSKNTCDSTCGTGCTTTCAGQSVCE